MYRLVFCVDAATPFSPLGMYPKLALLTPTRPCLLKRVSPMTRGRVGRPPLGCGSPGGRSSLILGLVAEVTGHLLVAPRQLRGRFVFSVDDIIVALIKRH